MYGAQFKKKTGEELRPVVMLLLNLISVLGRDRDESPKESLFAGVYDLPGDEEDSCVIKGSDVVNNSGRFDWIGFRIVAIELPKAFPINILPNDEAQLHDNGEC